MQHDFETDGAGVIESVVDLCTRKEWLQVNNPEILCEGQRLRVYAYDGGLTRGESVIMAVSLKHKRVYLSAMPSGTAIGDLLVAA